MIDTCAHSWMYTRVHKHACTHVLTRSVNARAPLQFVQCRLLCRLPGPPGQTSPQPKAFTWGLVFTGHHSAVAAASFTHQWVGAYRMLFLYSLYFSTVTPMAWSSHFRFRQRERWWIFVAYRVPYFLVHFLLGITHQSCLSPHPWSNIWHPAQQCWHVLSGIEMELYHRSSHFFRITEGSWPYMWKWSIIPVLPGVSSAPREAGTCDSRRWPGLSHRQEASGSYTGPGLACPQTWQH